MSDFFHLVDRNVASNPVARAIQRANVEREIRGFRIAMYLTPDAAKEEDNIRAAYRVLQVALVIALEKDEASADSRVMRGGLSALLGMAERGYLWRQADTPAIDVALDRALSVYMAAHWQDTQLAWQAVMQAERRAA